MFADAIGIAPSKDNFWSKKYQPGNKYRKLAIQSRIVLLYKVDLLLELISIWRKLLPINTHV